MPHRRPMGSLRLLATLLIAVLAAGVIGSLVSAAPADPASASPEKPPETLLSLLVKGRWIMVPMAFLSVATLTLAFERLISLRRARIGSPALAEAVFAALPPRNQAGKEHGKEALRLCDESRSVVGRVLRVGVEKLHRDEAHAQAALEEAAAREAHVLRRKIRPFNVISSLGPLLGLLGTISGMITCFEKATSADTGSRVTTLTQGIYEALVATASGLFIAILALILYHFFLGVLDRIGDRVDEAATRFLEHYYGTAGFTRPKVTHGSPRAKGEAEPAALEAGER